MPEDSLLEIFPTNEPPDVIRGTLVDIHAVKRRKKIGELVQRLPAAGDPGARLCHFFGYNIVFMFHLRVLDRFVYR